MNKDIQLYSMATPNGQKVGIALEEMGLPYTPHLINLQNKDQFKPEFVKISPNSKIPAIVDPDGPDGKTISIFESGAILVYLAEKSGKFLPKDPVKRMATLEWLFFQVGGVGPIFGQFGHFYKFAADQCKDPYPLQRYTTESKRFLGTLERRLSESKFLAGDEYTIADMATVTWVHGLKAFYNAEKQLGLDEYPNTFKWADKIMERPQVAKGVRVCQPPK